MKEKSKSHGVGKTRAKQVHKGRALSGVCPVHVSSDNTRVNEHYKSHGRRQSLEVQGRTGLSRMSVPPHVPCGQCKD